MLKGYEVTGASQIKLRGDLAGRKISISLIFLPKRRVAFLLQEGDEREIISFLGEPLILKRSESRKQFWEKRVISVEFWPGTGTVYLRTRNTERWYFSKIANCHFRTATEIV